MNELNAIAAIASRDLTKFLRDRPRIFASFAFPFLLIGVLGNSLAANIKGAFDFLPFVFTGVLAQILFQSTAAGVISLIEDRQNDFSQEIFVAPISRYSIVLGKIIGESLVALAQGLGVILFAVALRIPLAPLQLLRLLPVMLVCCLFGGAFGILVLANLNTQRLANQIFPFVIFPQFFLAGVFNPIKELPLFLHILSRAAPLTYAVDLMRNTYYSNSPAYQFTVLHAPLTNLLVIVGLFFCFLVVGTLLFSRNERNR